MSRSRAARPRCSRPRAQRPCTHPRPQQLCARSLQTAGAPLTASPPPRAQQCPRCRSPTGAPPRRTRSTSSSSSRPRALPHKGVLHVTSLAASRDCDSLLSDAVIVLVPEAAQRVLSLELSAGVSSTELQEICFLCTSVFASLFMNAVTAAGRGATVSH